MATPIPANAAPFTLAEVVRATGGQVLVQGDGRAAGVATDSRADVAGKLFVALCGEQYDGHRFVADVVARGAAGVLVSEESEVGGGAAFVVRVPSTLRALGALAHWHRQRWGGTVVAIGGSAGKTTTRSAVSALLGELYPGSLHFARGNLNNLVGVPMVLLGVEPRHRLAVVELGTNALGEVGKLAAIAQPDLAVLTLIAVEHSAGLGSLDSIENEEGDLLAAVGAAGSALVNGDDPRALRQQQRCPAATQLTFGTGARCDYRLVGRRPLSLGCSELALERPGPGGRETVTVQAAVLGEPGARAVAAALAVADRLAASPVDPARVTAALGSASQFEPGRLATLLLGDGTVVVDDTYNANPASVRSAVATAQELARARGARLLLVIGEMRELGDDSRSEHARLGEELGRSGAGVLIAIGGDAEHLVPPARAGGVAATFAADAEQAARLVLAEARAGDVVLVKASRGIRAERVVAALREAKGVAPSIYELLYPLSHRFGWAGVLNVLRYTPFRAIMATVTAMLLCFLVAPWFIRQLRGKQISQIIREEGPETHFAKAGTPTMGGALILLSVLVPTVLWADVKNVFVMCTTAVTAGYGAVGYLDDRLKIEGMSSRGLPGRYKLLLQFAIAGVILAYLFFAHGGLPAEWLALRDRLSLPFLAFNKHPLTLPAWAGFAFALVLVVGMSNAVNLTDGLDGLAIGPVMINAGTYLIWAYVAGSVLFGRSLAQYLDVAGIPQMAELSVYAAAVIGAGIGFLWYNTYPAQVFMGDVGSLSLGGGLGMLAVLTKNELLGLLIGGLFVVEAASVITQVASYQLFGKRVFLMAPIHHHFEKKGWPEPRIIVRFWIISILLALVGLSSLKLR